MQFKVGRSTITNVMPFAKEQKCNYNIDLRLEILVYIKYLELLPYKKIAMYYNIFPEFSDHLSC